MTEGVKMTNDAVSILAIPLDYMEYGPKTVSLALTFRCEEDRARFVAVLRDAGVQARGEP